jgi:hypothetical protein
MLSEFNMTTDLETKMLEACGQCDSKGTEHKKCARCKRTLYCSKEHQVQHWYASAKCTPSPLLLVLVARLIPHRWPLVSQAQAQDQLLCCISRCCPVCRYTVHVSEVLPQRPGDYPDLQGIIQRGIFPPGRLHWPRWPRVRERYASCVVRACP